MEIFVYRHGDSEVKEGFKVEHLPELLNDPSVVVWVDMERPSEADDQVLLDVFHFHPLTVEDCRANRHHPKVEEFPSYLYFIVHGVKPDTNSDHFNTMELDGYLGRNFVLTYHHEAFRSIDDSKQRVRSSPISCQRGASFFLHQIIDHIVDQYLPVLDDFDERINTLEDNIFGLRRPDNRMLEQVLDIKRSVLRLRRISSKQLDILYRMSHGEFELIDQQSLPFYRDVYDHLVRVMDMAENYRDLIQGALDAYHSVVANRLNEIMKLLTIFSAVMLPLTLIAGVYGMNFEYMPELKSPYGYFIAIGAMASVALGLLIFFWRKGWIGQDKG